MERTFYVAEHIDLPTESKDKIELRLVARLKPEKNHRITKSFHDWVKEHGENNTTYFLIQQVGLGVHVRTRTERVIEAQDRPQGSSPGAEVQAAS